MRIFPALIFFLLSCNANDKQLKTEKKETAVGSSVRLSYYKCDYSKQEYDTILSSGDENTTTEVWGINKSDIATLSNINKQTLDTTAIVKVAALYLRKRFPDVAILSSDCNLERIDEQDTANPKNWFIVVNFLYDKRGYYQKVPVLVDGRIVLSNNE